VLAANGVSQWDRARVIVVARATNDASMDGAAGESGKRAGSVAVVVAFQLGYFPSASWH
tara:strand:- start:1357 stop:1533 length:177 start_codon:yes stop_codon:yes gene_type:complete